MPTEIPKRSLIVVGVDGSPASIRAFRWALDQAEVTGATVEAVRAWDVPSSYGMPPVLLPGEDLAAAAERSLAATIEEASADKAHIPVQQRVMRGHPATVLLERAREADLLVVGSHGHGAFVGALIGSISHHCVQHAACPVVVVRTPAKTG